MQTSSSDTWVASREFELDGRQLRLEVGAPMRHPKGDWTCAFRIVGIDNDSVYTTAGADSLQALIMAMEMARLHLEAHSLESRLTWLGQPVTGLGVHLDAE